MVSEARRAYNREYYRRNRDKWKRTPEQQDAHNAARREQYRRDPGVRAQRNAAAKAYREANPERRKLTQYGLDPYVLEMLTDAGCGICGASFEWPGVKRHIDHDHATGKTRGVLCQPCNLALGHFNDDPIVLMQAVKYLMAGGSL